MKPLFLLFLISILSLSTMLGQQEVIRVEVFTGSIPESITWSLYDQSYQVLASVDAIYAASDSLYTHETAVPSGECYIIKIRDFSWINSNSLTDTSVYFNIYQDDVLIASGNPYDDGSILMNCPVGSTCENAIEIRKLPFEYNTDLVSGDTWFFYLPRVQELYQVNSCTVDENLPSKEADTDLWIYKNCDLIPNKGPEGAIFSLEGEECADIASINLNKTTRYLFRVRSNEDNPHGLNFSIDLSDSITGCTDINSCNFNPYARIDDGSCFYDNCLPDLEIADIKSSIFLDTRISNDPCLIDEGCLTGLGLRDIIRFGTTITNIGNADYIIGAEEDGSEIFSRENCHRHTHVLGYAEYLLFDKNSNLLPTGNKNGFCVTDLNCGNTKAQYHCDYMGITVGCSDIYTASTECQWIDITDVPDGKYTLVNRINWTRIPDLRGKEESTYDNNWSQACIEIDRSQGETQLEVFDDCPVYRDCFGIAFGSGVRDCAGVCGGVSHYGDANNDLTLNDDDVSTLLRDIMDEDLLASSCYDLNGDGTKSLYDAALLQQCIASSLDSIEDHTHCEFPSALINEMDTVEFEILDLAQGKFDLAYHSESSAIIGFGVSFDNINIDSIALLDSSLYISNTYYNNDEIIILNKPEDALPVTSDVRSIIRVYFSDIVESTVCIGEVDDIITVNYSSIQHMVRQQCIISSTTDVSSTDNRILISPNPIYNSTLHIKHDGLSNASWKIYNTQGSLMRSGSLNAHTQQEIELESIQSGCYYIHFEDEKSSIIKKFVKM